MSATITAPEGTVARETLHRAEEVRVGDTVPAGFVDFHSHLVPGVDDGARDLAEAVRAVETLAGEGIRHVLTTPHLDASVISRTELFEKQQREVEAAWFQVVDACVDRDPPMSFHLGREILLDNRDAVRASLTAFRTALDDLEALVAAGDGPALTAYLARMRATREKLA